MADQLVEIEKKYLPKLKNVYDHNRSNHYIACMTIENYIRWFEQNPSLKHIKIYCLNGNFTDGTFVITDRCSAYADTISDSYDNLERLLQMIDYSKGFTFLSIRSELHQTFIKALQKMKVEIIRDDTTLLYYLSKEEAMTFEARPNDIELRPLSKLQDIEKANSLWPHCNPNSLPFFIRMAEYNPNIGAFRNDTLVAWILRLPTGLLGALQTDKNYYGKGYGSLVVKYISKCIAEMGHDVYAGIFEANIPSRSLFYKLGFRPIGEVHWITTKITWSSIDE